MNQPIDFLDSPQPLSSLSSGRLALLHDLERYRSRGLSRTSLEILAPNFQELRASPEAQEFPDLAALLFQGQIREKG
jgi:hypothetical protein